MSTGTGTEFGTGTSSLCPGGGDVETDVVYIDATSVIDTGLYAGPGYEFESETFCDICKVCGNCPQVGTALYGLITPITCSCMSDSIPVLRIEPFFPVSPPLVGTWETTGPSPSLTCNVGLAIVLQCDNTGNFYLNTWDGGDVKVMDPTQSGVNPLTGVMTWEWDPVPTQFEGCPSGTIQFTLCQGLPCEPFPETGTGTSTSTTITDYYCAPDPTRDSQVLACIGVPEGGAPPLDWRSGPWPNNPSCGDCPGGTIFCVQWTAYNDDNQVIPTPPIQTCMSVDPGSYNVGDTFPNWDGSGAPPPYAPPLPPGYATATASCTISGPPGGVNFIGVISGGAGYTSAPSVRFIDTIGGSGAAAHAVLGAVGGPAEGTVIAVLIDNPGSGYDNPPLVVIGPPTGPDVMFDHWGATFLDGPFPDDGGCEAACGGCSGTLTGTSSCDCDPADPDCLRTVWFCVPPPLGGSPTAPHITPVYSNDPTQGFCVEAQVYSDGPLPNFGGPFATLADCVASPCPQPSGGGLMLSPVKTTTLRQPQPRPRPVEGKRLSLAQLDRGEGTPCKHRGADTGETDWCAGCQATRREVPLYNCTLHNDVCTGWTPTARGDLCCRTCQDRSP